jgi:hypothetical protein
MVSQGWLECPNQNQYFSIDYLYFTVSCLGGSTEIFQPAYGKWFVWLFFFKYLLCLKHTSVF